MLKERHSSDTSLLCFLLSFSFWAVCLSEPMLSAIHECAHKETVVICSFLSRELRNKGTGFLLTSTQSLYLHQSDLRPLQYSATRPPINVVMGPEVEPMSTGSLAAGLIIRPSTRGNQLVNKYASPSDHFPPPGWQGIPQLLSTLARKLHVKKPEHQTPTLVR